MLDQLTGRETEKERTEANRGERHGRKDRGERVRETGLEEEQREQER